jgi:hypothetical protein
MTDMLNAELADNLKFREDVAVVQNSGLSNITCDFAGKDRIDLTRTGGTLNISVANIGDGETVYLLIRKTEGYAITFTGVTDVTPVIENVSSLETVLYEIVRKGTYYFARAWVETVKQATTIIPGIARLATQAESNALSRTDLMLTPGRQPLASYSQKGLIEVATSAEVQLMQSETLAVTPFNLPISSTTQRGLVEVATSGEIDAGTNTGSGTQYVVQPSELKRKYEAVGVNLLWMGQFNFSGNVLTKLAGSSTLTFGSDFGAGHWQFVLATQLTTANYFVTVMPASYGVGHINGVMKDTGFFDIFASADMLLDIMIFKTNI